MNVLAKWLCSSCSGTTVKFRNVMVCFVYYGRRVSSQVAFDWRVSVHTQPNISVCTVTKTFKKTSLRAGGSSKRLFPILRADAQTLNTALTWRSRQAGAVLATKCLLAGGSVGKELDVVWCQDVRSFHTLTHTVTAVQLLRRICINNKWIEM